MIKNPEITVVLNVYERLNNLSKQIEAINSQTIKPHQILIWQNRGSKKLPKITISAFGQDSHLH